MPKIIRLFTPPINPVAITRKGNNYQLSYLLDASTGIYAQHDLTQVAGLPGGFLTNQMYNARVGVPMLSIDDTNAAVVRAGTWVRPIVAAATYGGTYGFSITTGSTATFTSPASATALGIRSVKGVNGGFGRVTGTTANLLPTAQDEVTAGRLDSTALIANGGTLAPTDRLFNFYSPSLLLDEPVAISDNLAAGVHTLVIECTGYKQAESTDVRIYDSGYSYSTAATRITDVGAVIMGTELINSVASAWENAYSWNGTFIGNVHGFEEQTSSSVTVDGVVTAVPDLTTLTGSAIAFTRSSILYDPTDGTTPVGTVEYTYRLTNSGLKITYTITWSISATIGPGYAAMLPLDASFNKGCTSAISPLTLTAADGTFKGAAKADAVWLWQTTGKYAVLMWVPTSPTPVNNWSKSAGRFMCIEDRSPIGGFKINKGYYTRQTGSGLYENVTNGTVWTGETIYRVARFNAGADSVLANI